ncbi:hypothetical protein IC582_022664 [Cucumis melo]|uniref:Myb/SANT-like DNA-binding domain-containing protein n=2 Tax=Cucumis melo TaxID=3656 RepID=A0A9I9D3J4_CUCME
MEIKPTPSSPPTTEIKPEIKSTPSSPPTASLTLTQTQTSPSLLFNHHHHHQLPDDNPSPKENHVSTGGGGGGKRLKRDEWSDGAVSTLLDAYESKWILRNRAKLKGHDWEDVARHVSSRSNFTKSSKTHTQCKNKIESMKKKCRAIPASAASSWPWNHRVQHFLGGNSNLTPPPSPPPPLVDLVDPPPPPPSPPPFLSPQNSHGSNGVDNINPSPKEDGVDNGRGGDELLSEKNKNKNKNNSNNKKKMVPEKTDSSSSTPAAIAYSTSDEKLGKGVAAMRSKLQQSKMKKKKRRRRSGEVDSLEEIAGSIRWLAEVVVRSEQARMEMIKDIEKMRAEAEAKRGELDLKRTQIIANTQLEIAKLFASPTTKPLVDHSSLRIART